MRYKKISVLIVTYKQADVIGRNIESILQQKEYGLHEIVICDDCSLDNNWAVIQNYAEMYPNIIRAYRNNHNLGIYGNSDKCASLHGDADLFCWLEGDDALEPNFFKSVQDFIAENNIDTTGAIGIFGNYSLIKPSGEKTVRSNANILQSYSPLSLYIRNIVSWRASLFSKSVIEQFRPTVLDRGLGLAEILFDSQWFMYIDKVYYCNILGSIYYQGIGVSQNLGIGSSFRGEQSVVKWKYLLDHKISNIDKDLYWIKFKINQSKFLVRPSLLYFLRSLFYYSLGIIRPMWGLSYVRRDFYLIFRRIKG